MVTPSTPHTLIHGRPSGRRRGPYGYLSITTVERGVLHIDVVRSTRMCNVYNNQRSTPIVGKPCQPCRILLIYIFNTIATLSVMLRLCFHTEDDTFGNAVSSSLPLFDAAMGFLHHHFKPLRRDIQYVGFTININIFDNSRDVLTNGSTSPLPPLYFVRNTLLMACRFPP